MNRAWVMLAILVCPLVTLAQNSPSPRPGATPSRNYQPSVPSSTTVNAYGGWGGNYGASTAAGSAMNGMASAISAAGDYNLATSAAAVNMTQAQHNEIQNRQEWTNTYFEMRATNRAARAAERGPKPTMEQLVRIAHDGAPSPLKTSQVDPVSGSLAWPGPLQAEGFDAQRAEVQQLFAKRASQGGLDYTEQAKARQAIQVMREELKAQIKDIPPQDYVASRDFLRSLNYAASKTEMQ